MTNRLCVVIGGGAVGRRKAADALAAGATVRIVCLEDKPRSRADLATERVDWLAEPYRAEHLADAVLVFAAATPEVNRRVVADARKCGIWVNVADDPTAGDFLVPAVLRRGRFVIAVGTGGAAPALACAVRDQLAGQFDETHGTWTELLGELRPLCQSSIPDAEQRRQVLAELCRPEWLDRLRREGADTVRSAMYALVERASSSPQSRRN